MNKKKIIIFLLIILCYIIYKYFELDKTFSIENIIKNKNELINFTDRYFLKSMLIYILLFILLVGIGLPVTAVLSVSAGLLFSFHEAIIFIIFSATSAALISFSTARYVFSDYIRKKYHKEIEKVEEKVYKDRVKYILGLRLLPGMSFSLVNILAGISSIDMYNFLWTTIVGIIPSSIVLIFMGNGLRTLSDVNDFKAPKTIIPLGIIVFVIFIFIVKKVMKPNANKI